jgi:SPP1 gp7 family putative phage head morphogenesis protein
LKKKIGDPISRVWNVSGTRELKKVFGMAGEDIGDINFSHPEALARDVGRMAFQISESTARSVEKAITRDLALGLSVDEISANILRIGAFAPSRAMRIARTESARAVNDAANQAYRQAKAELGINIKKQWLSSRDDKVREAHQILDGQMVGVDENFQVDGEEAQSIADFGASYLDVNCRCTILPIILDD